MIAVGKRSTSEETRRPRPYPSGEIAYKAEWMKNGEDPRFSPTVFLYEQPGNTTLSAHFHHNNQFQIIIDGEGKLGARKVAAVVVHYAGAYTAYGPLVAGNAGLKYFTLRTVHEAGAVRVADAQAGRAEWPKGPVRQATSSPIAITPVADLEGLAAPRVEVLIPLNDDGLEVRSVELPPHAPLDAVDPHSAAGIFLFVLSGNLQGELGKFEGYESVFLTADEAFPLLTAGDSGCHLLTLAMPKRDPAFT